MTHEVPGVDGKVECKWTSDQWVAGNSGGAEAGRRGLDWEKNLDHPGGKVVQCFRWGISRSVLWLVFVALSLSGFACVNRSVVLMTEKYCTATGWVDRIEEGLVVIEVEDSSGTKAGAGADSEEELIVPLTSFRVPVKPGQHLIAGRVDLEGTKKLRDRIRKLTEEVMGGSGSVD